MIKVDKRLSPRGMVNHLIYDIFYREGIMRKGPSYSVYECYHKTFDYDSLTLNECDEDMKEYWNEVRNIILKTNIKTERPSNGLSHKIAHGLNKKL